MIVTAETESRVFLIGKHRIAEIEKCPGYWITLGYVGSESSLMVNSAEELDEVISLLQEARKHVVPEEDRV